jgi:uncharacterized membrane protein
MAVVVLLGLWITVAPIAALVVVLAQRSRLRSTEARVVILGSLIDTLTSRLQSLERHVDAAARAQRAATPEEPAKPSMPAEPVTPPPAAQAAPPSEETTEIIPTWLAGERTERAARPARPKRPSTAVPAPRIERELGTRIAVWLGAVSLALAGAFLVKYSIDRGWLGPAARVSLGLAFGVSLLFSAEWLRSRVRRIAQGLAASGVSVLFASLLAAVKLYDLVPVTVGMGGMLVVTGAAVVLSVRHGQLVAILGLLGGFLTPVWIGGPDPRPWMLAAYLALIQAGLLLVSRRMRWWPVAALTLAGALGWSMLWIAELGLAGGDTMPPALFLLFSIASFVAACGSPQSGETWGNQAPSWLVWGATGFGTLLFAALVGAGGFETIDWAMFGILGVGCLVLAGREKHLEPLAWVAALLTAATLFAWTGSVEADRRLELWITTPLHGALYVIGAWWTQWRHARPDRWAALAAVSSVAFLLVGYAGLGDDTVRVPWGAQAVAVAAAMAALALPVARRRATLARGDGALAAYAVAVTSLVSLAVPMELERAWIGVAWAIEIPALAWIASRLRVPALEHLARALAVLVAGRLLLNPAIVDYPIGDGFPFNWLLYGYGVPIVALLVAARLFRRGERSTTATLLEAGAAVLGFALITLQVRQLFHPGDLAALEFPLLEWGTLCIAWLLYGSGLMFLHSLRPGPHLKWVGACAAVFGVTEGLLMSGLVSNPLIRTIAVGETPVLNSLLIVYGIPAVLCLLLAKALQRGGERPAAIAFGSASLLFAFLTLSLEVRQAFHGTFLTGGTTTNAEMYTYSLVWVLFATGLLVAGIATRGAVVRYGSAAVMTLAVTKVFLLDTHHLEDLYRVLSLFGLGVSLMLLAFLYQRYVFRQATP